MRVTSARARSLDDLGDREVLEAARARGQVPGIVSTTPYCSPGPTIESSASGRIASVIFCLPWAPVMGPERVVHLAAQRLNSVWSTTTTTGAPGSSNRRRAAAPPAVPADRGLAPPYVAASNWDYQTHHDRKTACLRGWLERLGVVGSMLHPG